MSIWIYRKNKTGKKSVTTISGPLFLIMVFIIYTGSLTAIFIQKGIDPIFFTCFYLACIGFIFFVISKILQFSRGVWNSWGMKEMPIMGKVFYVAGYCFMVFGIGKLLINL